MHEIKERTYGDDSMRSRRETIRLLVVLPLAAVLGVIGFLAAVAVARGATQTATVSLRTTKLGAVLVNPSGHTLYLFGLDKNGKSACAGSCAKYWPPLLSHGKPTAGRGVKAALLGTTKRSNGSLQVTYNRHPLYTFSFDKLAGQTGGEGSSAYGGKWYAVSAKGAAVLVKTGTTTTSATTTTTSTNCSYPPCP
jgi:predicted lipoprotein with Yx(FWY)xxD motif